MSREKMSREKMSVGERMSFGEKMSLEKICPRKNVREKMSGEKMSGEKMSCTLIFSCLETKGYGCGFKIMVAMPNLAKVVIFQSRGHGQLSLHATPMSSKSFL